jgi:hypothetical protein
VAHSIFWSIDIKLHIPMRRILKFAVCSFDDVLCRLQLHQMMNPVALLFKLWHELAEKI